MSTSSAPPPADRPPESPAAPPTSAEGPAAPSSTAKDRGVHEVTFVTYPKLLFIWPLILAGFVFWPLGKPAAPAPEGPPSTPTVQSEHAHDSVGGSPAGASTGRSISRRLHILGWLYIWILVLVFLTLGVDVDRNQAAFWILLVIALYVLGLWLHDVKHFTFFGDIYRWFVRLGVQYDRSFGLAVSIILLVPYLLMLLWGRINDRWRITHNEFEHYSFGRMDDSLGRGAKTIRTYYPDVFELLLGLAGTLIVYNATGTRELRRIPHVMLLPLVRKRLNRILETVSITTAQMEEEEDDEQVT